MLTKLDVVVPTHVGVNRAIEMATGKSASCPHARGGEPEARMGDGFASMLSPRTWG